MAKIKTKRERVKFASDNVAGACPEVLEAIIKANEGDTINVSVIGQRYELNDKYISVIGEIRGNDISQPKLLLN